MSGKIVEDHNITFGEGGHQLCFDIAVEDGAVHRRVDDPWGRHSPTTQARYEGLGVPVPERCRSVEPLATQTAATQARHFCGNACFIQKTRR